MIEQTSERKRGVVVHGRPEAGWWFVRVGEPGSLEVYFLHVSNIRSGSACVIGSVIEFEVGPLSRGTKPLAVNADIVGAQ
jgi:hypothetical protein